MEPAVISVRFFGDLVLSLGDQTVGDGDNRSRKAWLLLAYLLYFHHRFVPAGELIDLLWGGKENCADAANSLKTVLHRVRTTLDRLGPNVGHDLLIRKERCYGCSAAFVLRLDLDEFEQLCKPDAALPADEQLARYRQALELYRGDFLSKLSAEPWVTPIAAYYRNLYVQTALEAVALLDETQQPEAVVSLCERAMRVEPYNEALCLHRMRAQVAQGQPAQALASYEALRQLLASHFGIQPCEELCALQQQIFHSVNDSALPFDTIHEQLNEDLGASGAMVCGYDYFKVLYHALARGQIRSGAIMHIALFSLTDANGGTLPKRSLTCAAENLQALLQRLLRKGDVITRCSVSQFLVILPQANYENSCAVCDRILKAFTRQYPHSPADVHCSVRAVGSAL
jgi:DNA-binding SARP family transcriptional activator